MHASKGCSRSLALGEAELERHYMGGAVSKAVTKSFLSVRSPEFGKPTQYCVSIFCERAR
jgi:hypothetical protein